MDVSERMKYKLANAMKELLVHTPVDKITVKQIDGRGHDVVILDHPRDGWNLCWTERVHIGPDRYQGSGKTGSCICFHGIRIYGIYDG